MAQSSWALDRGLESIQTLVISRQRDFDGLFEGFTGLSRLLKNSRRNCPEKGVTEIK